MSPCQRTLADLPVSEVHVGDAFWMDPPYKHGVVLSVHPDGSTIVFTVSTPVDIITLRLPADFVCCCWR